jgi:hypothetical protein
MEQVEQIELMKTLLVRGRLLLPGTILEHPNAAKLVAKGTARRYVPPQDPEEEEDADLADGDAQDAASAPAKAKPKKGKDKKKSPASKKAEDASAGEGEGEGEVTDSLLPPGE